MSLQEAFKNHFLVLSFPFKAKCFGALILSEDLKSWGCLMWGLNPLLPQGSSRFGVPF